MFVQSLDYQVCLLDQSWVNGIGEYLFHSLSSQRIPVHNIPIGKCKVAGFNQPNTEIVLSLNIVASVSLRRDFLHYALLSRLALVHLIFHPVSIVHLTYLSFDVELARNSIQCRFVDHLQQILKIIGTLSRVDFEILSNLDYFFEFVIQTLQ